MDLGTRGVLVNACLCLRFLFGLLQWRVKMGLRARYDAMQSHSTAQQRKRQRFLLPKSGLLSLCSPEGLIAHTSDGCRSILEDNFYKQKGSLTRFASSSSALQRTSLFSKAPQNEASTYDLLRLAHPGSHPDDAHSSRRDTEESYSHAACPEDAGWHLISRRHPLKTQHPTVAGVEHTLTFFHRPPVSLYELPVAAAADALVSLHKSTTPAACADVPSSIPEQHANVAATDTPCESSSHATVAHVLVSLHEMCAHRETMSDATATPYQPLQTLAITTRAGSAAVTAPTPLGSPRVSQEGENSKPEPVYKQLLERIRSRDSRTKELQTEIDTEESLLEALQRTRKDLFALKIRDNFEKEEITASAAFILLSEEEEEEVHQALNGANRHEVLVQHEPSNIDLSRAALQCLKPGVWLNDEVINLYMELLKEREHREQKDYLKCHFFNTFFFNKLYKDARSYNFKAVRRWTTQRKLGYSLLECDKIFVPIHKDIHWCLAVINVREKKLQYLDSLKGHDENALQVLARYFEDEAKDKGTENVDTSSWDLDCPKDIPQQMNGCDCGMFMIKYADFLSRGNELKFTQEHMEYFRKRTVLELLQLQAR